MNVWFQNIYNNANRVIPNLKVKYARFSIHHHNTKTNPNKKKHLKIDVEKAKAFHVDWQNLIAFQFERSSFYVKT